MYVCMCMCARVAGGPSVFKGSRIAPQRVLAAGLGRLSVEGGPVVPVSRGGTPMAREIGVLVEYEVFGLVCGKGGVACAGTGAKGNQRAARWCPAQGASSERRAGGWLVVSQKRGRGEGERERKPSWRWWVRQMESGSVYEYGWDDEDHRAGMGHVPSREKTAGIHCFVDPQTRESLECRQTVTI